MPDGPENRQPDRFPSEDAGIFRCEKFTIAGKEWVWINGSTFSGPDGRKVQTGAGKIISGADKLSTEEKKRIEDILKEDQTRNAFDRQAALRLRQIADNLHALGIRSDGAEKHLERHGNYSESDIEAIKGRLVEKEKQAVREGPPRQISNKERIDRAVHTVADRLIFLTKYDWEKASAMLDPLLAEHMRDPTARERYKVDIRRVYESIVELQKPGVGIVMIAASKDDLTNAVKELSSMTYTPEKVSAIEEMFRRGIAKDLGRRQILFTKDGSDPVAFDALDERTRANVLAEIRKDEALERALHERTPLSPLDRAKLDAIAKKFGLDIARLAVPKPEASQEQVIKDVNRFREKLLDKDVRSFSYEGTIVELSNRTTTLRGADNRWTVTIDASGKVTRTGSPPAEHDVGLARASMGVLLMNMEDSADNTQDTKKILEEWKVNAAAPAESADPAASRDQRLRTFLTKIPLDPRATASELRSNGILSVVDAQDLLAQNNVPSEKITEVLQAIREYRNTLKAYAKKLHDNGCRSATTNLTTILDKAGLSTQDITIIREELVTHELANPTPAPDPQAAPSLDTIVTTAAQMRVDMKLDSKTDAKVDVKRK